jgi:tetratricopeptide (TPR) repeat protein
VRIALLGLLLAGGCSSADSPEVPSLAGPREGSDDESFPPEPPLTPPEAAVRAAWLIDGRETAGALGHAARLLRRTLDHYSDSVELWTLLAEAHARLADGSDLKTASGRRDHETHRTAAAQSAQEALRIDPDHGPARYWLGFTYLVMADGEQSYPRLRQALAELKKADTRSPTVDSGGPSRMIGRIYQETPGFPLLGSKTQAAKFYRRALELAPESAQAHLWLGETYLALKKPDLARPELEAAQSAQERPGHEKEDSSIRSQAEHLLDELPMK